MFSDEAELPEGLGFHTSKF